jgi:hypothetical protein
MKCSIAITFAAALLSVATASAQNNAFCTRTAQTLLGSCRTSARADLRLSQAKCLNVSDQTAREICEQQATSDSEAAIQLCDAELLVRQNACQRLGEARYDPVINPANFTNKVDNPYLPLKPGTVFVYEGTTGGAKVRSEFAVTRKTVQILGVTTVEVHDRVFTDGELTEDTLDWFAQDRDGNVWYFGENTEELIGGRPSTLSGTFTAGVDGAKPGIIMRGHPAIGNFDRQEFAAGEAEDFGEVVSLNDTVTVPEGTFTHVLRTHETTPLEPDLQEAKWYARGVGNVLTRDLTTGEEIKLIDIEDLDSRPARGAHESRALDSEAAPGPGESAVVKPRHHRFRPF